MNTSAELVERWPVFAACPGAAEWLAVESRLGLADRTIDAYGRAIVDFLVVCSRHRVDPLTATRAGVSVFVADMRERDVARAPKRGSAGPGLSNATIQLRLVAVRLSMTISSPRATHDEPGWAWQRAARRGVA